jgi:hypothetical protein
MTAALDGWQQAITAEQSAVYGYGALGPHLSTNDEVSLARQCEQAHRAQVQAGIAMLATLGGSPANPPAPTSAPVTVTDDASAQQLALTLEEATASAWRYVLAQLATTLGAGSVAPARAMAVSSLSDAAVRAVQWRRLRNPAQPSVAFPGI